MNSIKTFAIAAFALIALAAADNAASAAVCGESGRSAIAETETRAIDAASRKARRVAWHYCKRDFAGRIHPITVARSNCPRSVVLRGTCHAVQVFNHPGFKCWTKVACHAKIYRPGTFSGYR